MAIGQWCSFPDGWTSSAMPFGDPSCIHYKGSQSQRISELKRAGHGSHQIDEWNQWYEDKATAARVDAVIKSRLAVVDAELGDLSCDTTSFEAPSQESCNFHGECQPLPQPDSWDHTIDI